MIKYNSQADKRKRGKSYTDKVISEIFREDERKKAFEERQIHLDENASRLKGYIEEIRKTYSGETLSFLEQNVISRWASFKYRRDASLAHFDVENALKGLNNQ